jgi:autotransporter-associated beta strand protein
VTGAILSSTITGSGVLTKIGGPATTTGAGVLTLTNATNTGWTGGVAINSGLISISADADLGATSSPAGIELNGGGLQVTSTFATSRTLTDNSTAATNDVDVTDVVTPNVLTENGVLVGIGTFNKTSNGTFVLTQASPNFSGIMTVTGGVLNIQNSGALGYAPTISLNGTSITLYGTTVGVNATLQLQSAITVGNEALSLTGNGVAGTGALQNLSGANTWGGTISLAGATTIQTVADSLTLSNGSSISGNQALTLNIDGSSSMIVQGTIADTAAITKNGAGTFNLSMTSIGETGALIVNQGIFLLNGLGIVANSTDTINSGGTLTLDNSGTAENNRLGGATKNITIQGGAFNLNGNASLAVAENIATLTVGSGGGIVSLTGFGGLGTTLNLTSLATQAQGGSLLIQGLNITSGAGLANVSVPSAAAMNYLTGQGGGSNNTATMSIRPDIIGDIGVDLAGISIGFLTRDTATGFLRPLGSGGSNELVTTLGSSATTNYGAFTSTQTYGLGGTAIANTSVNSLSLTGFPSAPGVNTTGGGQAVQTVGAISYYQGFAANATPNMLTVTTGGVLATEFTSLNVGALTTNSSNQFEFHVTGFATLDVTGFLWNTSTGGLTKADSGTLNLDNSEYYLGTTTVNGGMLLLNSGVANTIVVTPTATGETLQTLVVNGGTLDLNGQNQAVALAANNDTIGGTGGTITNNGGAVANFITSSSGTVTFGGVFANGGNALNLWVSGSGTLTLTGASTYTGTTNIQGNVTIQDGGSITSSTINIDGATLSLTNNGLNDNATRIPTTAQVNLNTGTLVYQGANGITSSETVGNPSVPTSTNGLVLAQGNNTITVNPGTTGSVVLTIGNLARTTGSGATVNFTTTGTPVLGQAPNGSLVSGVAGTQIFISNLNGSAFSVAGGGLTNGIIGGWATINTGTVTDFASYVDSNSTQGGVGALGTTNYPAYSTNTFATGVAANNIKVAATLATTTGAQTFNSLNVAAPAAATTLTITTSLSLGTGGLIIDDSANKNVTITGGTLTSGATELFAYVSTTSGVETIASVINGAVDFVKSGPGPLILTGNNTYSGTTGTVVNGGTLTLSTASANGTSVFAIPGNLTINNGGTVTETLLGEIKNTAAVTINGGGVLTMAGTSNTLSSVTFNGNGGTATPTLNVGTLLILSASNAINEPNNNFATTPTILGTALQLSSTTPVITVSGLSPVDLIITAPITSAGGNVSITGGGSVVLNGANTFTTGVTLNSGALIFGVGTTGTVTNGPVGTGTLTINGGTIMSAGSTGNFTIANAVNVGSNDSFTFGGTGEGAASSNNVTLSGTVTLNGANTMTVTSPLVKATISGKLTGGTSLTKAGAGTLVLSNATNNYGGATNVSGGLLQLGNAAAIPTTSQVIVAKTAAFDIAGVAASIGSLAGDTATTGGLVTNSGVAATLTIGSDNTSPTFAGVITNAANALSLTKTGTGTQTLAGANTYVGATTVGGTGGGLYISGSLGATAVSVGGGVFLGGTGVIGTTTASTGGTVIVAGGSTAPTQGSINLEDGKIGTLTIQGNTTPGTFLTLGGATGGAASVLDFDLGNTTTDSIVVTNGGMLTLQAGGAIVDLNALAGTVLQAGTYNLLTYATGSTLTGIFTLGTITGNGGFTYSLNTTSTAEQLIVTLNSPPPTNAYWVGGIGAVPTAWNSFQSASNNTNFLNAPAGTNTLQLPGSITNVFFTANTAGNLNTTLGQPFTINSLSFTGTNPVTTTAAGNSVTIGGASTLTILAASSFTDAAANNYPIGTGLVVQGGSAAHTISAPIILGSSQTWINNSTSALTLSGGIGDGGAGDSLTTSSSISGSGAFVLYGGNTYSGGTNVTNGSSLSVPVTGSLSSGSPLTVDSNAGSSATFANVGQILGAVSNGDATASSLNFSATTGTVTMASLTGAGSTNFASSATITTTFDTGTATVAGVATIGTANSGTLNLNSTTTSAITTLNGPTTVNLGSGTALTVNNGTQGATGSITGATGSLTKGGGSGDTLTLAGTNTYGGATNVNAGTMVVSGSISGTSSVNVGTGVAAATLAVASGGSITTAGAVNVQNNAILSGSLNGAGNGAVNAASVTVQNGGVLAPSAGDTAGLTISGGPLTFSSTSTLQLSLANSDGANQPFPSDYSKLTLGAGVVANLNGTLVTNVPGSINQTDLFTIIIGNTSGSPSSISGVFANANTQVTGSTYQFGNGYINYSFSPSAWAALPAQNQNLAGFESISGGNSVALYAVPEPSSLGMLLGSLGLALGLQRFRRRRS